MASLHEDHPLPVSAFVVRRTGVLGPLHRGGHAANAEVLLPGLPSPRLLRLWLDLHRLGKMNVGFRYKLRLRGVVYY